MEENKPKAKRELKMNSNTMIEAGNVWDINCIILWIGYLLEMGPDPTRAYFWPTVNKGMTPAFDRGIRGPNLMIFFRPKGKKLKYWDF